MNVFSLKTLIDDILLLVRNNNISESEDLSRMQIAAWILAYKKSLLKQRKDQEKNADKDVEEDSSLTEMLKTVGPLELVYDEPMDNIPQFKRITKDKIPALLDNDENNIVIVTDQSGCVIQKMEGSRKHYHQYRKYTRNELTFEYENGYIVVHGKQDCGFLKYIWVKGIFEDNVDLDDPNLDEDDIEIPGWMIPDIKKLIFENELSFMLNRPSDDDNNSTLDGIKPQSAGQQQINEK